MPQGCDAVQGRVSSPRRGLYRAANGRRQRELRRVELSAKLTLRIELSSNACTDPASVAVPLGGGAVLAPPPRGGRTPRSEVIWPKGTRPWL